MKQYNLKDIYIYTVNRMLIDNPTYWKKRCRLDKTPVVYEKRGARVVEVITWRRFRAIIYHWLEQAQDKIIEGDVLEMLHIGKLYAARVERNFSKKTINFQETMKQPKVQEGPRAGKPERIIYYDSEDWCRIRWDKPYKRLKWVEVYEFKPTDSRGGEGGFKDKFRKAIMNNRALQLNYKYIPFYPQ